MIGGSLSDKAFKLIIDPVSNLWIAGTTSSICLDAEPLTVYLAENP